MDSKLAHGLSLLTTGIYVLTVNDGQQRHGMSSSWVTQVSGDPPLLMAAVDQRHFTHGIVERTGRFALNVIGRDHRELEDHFYSASARRPDNLESIAHRGGASGLPLIAAALASLECRVVATHPAGDHSLFVASVEHVTVRPGGPPLTSLDLDYVYVGAVVKRPR
ncbi:MAG TPA: flavin reductase family protein [Candidatus Kryptonia bacterium]|nr:flavin reductase family protein [Candidatus Kryptonia bacterium]